MICCAILLSFICLLYISTADINDGTLVNLPEGQIRGHILNTPNNKEYYAFQEIPYAAPPIGKLRLQSPVPPEEWEGVLDTTQNTKICYQSGTYIEFPDVTQTEDCLYLNVYTPVTPGNIVIPLPVLVWVHGGGFISGSGIPQQYKPQYFLDDNIIIVSINYRVGALGFLTTEDGIIPGNIGLRDQNFAFQWVKKNIHLFGGDPEKITIAGESAGGTSIGFHLVSPQNEGLFRAAILQSGTALCGRTSHQDYARYYAFKLGRSLNSSFTSDDSEELLNLLQSLPASDINDNTVLPEIGKEAGLIEGGGHVWLAVLEDANIEDAFLFTPFEEDIKNGDMNQVPILIGFNSEEELLFLYGTEPSYPEDLAKYFDNDLSNLIRNKFNMTKENKLTAGRKLREIYTDGLLQDDPSLVVKFLSDESFTTPIIRHAKLQSKYTDVYLYQFSYKGDMPGMKGLEIAGVQGVTHAEDLAYLWDTRLVANTTTSPEDLVIRDRLLTLWSNFVKYLNPTPEKDNLLENVIWEKVSPNNLVYLDINSTLEIQKNPKEYLKFEKIIDVYAIPPLINY